MKTGFKDRTEVKNEKPPYTPDKGKNTPWDFRAPEYDQRSSCFVNTGTRYGEAMRQPVGTKTHTSEGGVPIGRVNTLNTEHPESR